MFVINDNISVVDPFKFKCKHCNTEFDIPDVKRNCPNPECNVELFERMTKSNFKSTFHEALTAIGIDANKATKFMKDKDVKLNSLGLCNQLTTIMDSNLNAKFGGQYKSFLVDESFSYILNYNFNGD